MHFHQSERILYASLRYVRSSYGNLVGGDAFGEHLVSIRERGGGEEPAIDSMMIVRVECCTRAWYVPVRVQYSSTVRAQCGTAPYDTVVKPTAKIADVKQTIITSHRSPLEGREACLQKAVYKAGGGQSQTETTAFFCTSMVVSPLIIKV